MLPVESAAASTSFTMKIPRGAAFLYARQIGLQIHMWYMHDLGEDEVPIQFFLCSDGDEIPESVVNTVVPLASWWVDRMGQHEGKHLFVQYDPEDNDWALGALWGKQLAPDKPKPKSDDSP